MKRFVSLVCFLGTLSALPTNPLVQTGDVNIQNDKLRTVITASDFAEIDWQDFSISQNESVRFIQPSEQALAINRVISSQPSVLMGNLEANGQIMLINQNGVFVGKDAYLDVGSWIASTLDLVDKESFHFAGESSASIINGGTICSKTGDVILISQNVENSGDIEAKQGSILFGAGKEIYYQPNEKNRLFVRLSDEQIMEGKGIDNSGTLTALHTELVADGNLYAYAIHHSGDIDALGVKEVNGEIFLVAEEGLNQVHGSLTATGENGGTIHILGKRVALDGKITVDASGETHGGEILIGGDYKGSNPEYINSEYTYVGEDVAIHADAMTHGKGGKVIVWGDDISAMYGSISALGGSQSGDGGFVEISSPKGLFAKGAVDTSAPFGKNGTLLLDPCATTITGAATTGGVTNSTPPPQPLEYDFGVLAAANILNTEIIAFLATNDVTIDAASSGSGASGTGSITVTSDISWTSGNKLTLISDSTISMQADIVSGNNGLADTTVVIDLQAPVIEIGSSSYNGIFNVGANSGAISANFPTSMTIYGGDVGSDGNTITASSGILYLTGGNLSVLGSATTVDGQAFIQGSATVNLTGDLLLQGQLGPAAFNNNNLANVEINADNMTILGGSGTGSPQAGIIQNDGGNVTVVLDGDLNITGGTASTQGPGLFFSSGPGTDFNISARNISFTGGAGAGINSAGFIHQGTGSSNSTVTASGTLTLTGGGLNGSVFTTKTDPLSNLTVNANELNISSGSVSTANAQLGGTGNVTVSVTNNMNVTSLAGGGVATIQLTGASKQLDVTVGGDITINGNGSSCGILAQEASSVANISCRNCTFSSGPLASNGTVINAEDGTLNFTASGSCTANGSSSAMAPFVGFLGASNPGSVLEMNLEASSFSFVGGSSIGAFAGVILGASGGTGILNLTATGAGGITLTGGTATDAYALFVSLGTNAANAINFQATHPDGNVILNGSSSTGVVIQTNSGSITDPTGGSIIFNGTAAGPLLISVGASSSADLLLQTGVNIELAYTTIENLSSGDVTLVVDNDFSDPSIGTGAFIMDENSAITTTGGALRIFTSSQTFNSILGTLNGSLFTPGTTFVDTTTEQWSTYYPSLDGGFPYTVFYKDNEELLAHQGNVIASEMTQFFNRPWFPYHGFNEYLGWPSLFVISYEVPEEKSLRLRDEPYFLNFKNNKLVD